MARRVIIALGYLGIAAIIAGIFVMFINHHNPVKTFETINEVSGAVVFAVGVLLLVISAFTVRKWFKKR